LALAPPLAFNGFVALHTGFQLQQHTPAYMPQNTPRFVLMPSYLCKMEAFHVVTTQNAAFQPATHTNKFDIMLISCCHVD
jgi:hypothetical protein